MADELTDYLQGDYTAEKRDIKRLSKEAGQIVRGLLAGFLDEGVWAYEVVDGQAIRPPDRGYSFSTNAMILFALATATGRISSSSLIPKVQLAPIPFMSKAESKNALKAIQSALSRMRNEMGGRGNAQQEEAWLSARREWREAQSARSRQPAGPLATTSGSFGSNDPLTLTWLLDLLSGHPSSGTTVVSAEDRAWLVRRLRSAASEIVNSTFIDPTTSPLRLAKDQAPTHAFLFVRVLHLFSALRRSPGVKPVDSGTDRIAQALLQRAHHQLSLSGIRNSSFDAGELVFSLEGVLLCDPGAPDYSLFDRAFEVLVAKQAETPYWRPLRPFRVTSQGMVLLPQSVEIANSLLRVCAKLDDGRDSSYFTRFIELFKAYTSWLESWMAVVSDAARRQFHGWESEHTLTSDRIHLWQTSQALLYLMHYGAMLQEHIARRSYRAARFSESISETKSADPSSWDRWKENEPLGSFPADSPYRAYRRIGEEFIQPRMKGSRRNSKPLSSVLLYGPPGTGKSTIAKEIATALGYRMVTVTPSDFITAGQEGTEARAKNIFATLMEQNRLLVLFDEIDQFLLDRGSTLYRAQGDIFKLITPGMLTKFNDLTSHKGVVFVVATNYIERIDAAIKRPGRIDARMVVLPPDRAQRRRFLAEGRVQERDDGGTERVPLIDGWLDLEPGDREAIINSTALYTFKELIDLSEHLRRGQSSGSDLKKRIDTGLSEFPPTISIRSYRNRVFSDKHQSPLPADESPLEEFVLVVYLAVEAGQFPSGYPTPPTPRWVVQVLRQAKEERAVAHRAVWTKLASAGVLRLAKAPPKEGE